MNRQKEPKLRVRGETNPTRSLDSVENRTGTSKRKETPPLALLPAKSVDVSHVFWHSELCCWRPGNWPLISFRQLGYQDQETNWTGHWKNAVLENYHQKVEERLQRGMHRSSLRQETEASEMNSILSWHVGSRSAIGNMNAERRLTEMRKDILQVFGCVSAFTGWYDSMPQLQACENIYTQGSKVAR